MISWIHWQLVALRHLNGQTHKQSDIASTRLNWHRGRFSEKCLEQFVVKLDNSLPVLPILYCTVLWLCDCVTVWLCDCVTMWLCDCVTVWLCDCVTVWLCNFVTLWQWDSVTVRQCDSVTVWLCYCVTLWLCDCSDCKDCSDCSDCSEREPLAESGPYSPCIWPQPGTFHPKTTGAEPWALVVHIREE